MPVGNGEIHRRLIISVKGLQRVSTQIQHTEVSSNLESEDSREAICY